MKKRILFITAIIGLLLTVWVVMGYYSARYLTSKRGKIYKTPSWTTPRENIDLLTEDNVRISGWFIKKDPEKVVIILAGIGSDRHTLHREG